MPSKANLLITGITGFIGTELQKKLLECGTYTLFGLVRNEEKKRSLLNRSSPKNDAITYITLQDIENKKYYFDTIINLAGENIAGQRWSEKRKHTLYSSRVTLTEQLYSALETKPKHFISMSAIGIYGAKEGAKSKKVYDENHVSSQKSSYDFPAELCQAWENSAQAFSRHETRVCIVRLGVVLGYGGALQKMLPAFKMGLGGKIASGKQWMPWIHIDDATNLILFLVENQNQKGIFNAVAPQPTRQEFFAKALAKTLHRPCYLATPKWLLDIIFGEMASLLTHGVRVYPSRTLAAGFLFKHDRLLDALHNLYSKS
ncbi:TIGR01777 family protein [Marinomonas agarivorans]|nr:TIGR01777 family protein [Marinomonas agarivorans]